MTYGLKFAVKLGFSPVVAALFASLGWFFGSLPAAVTLGVLAFVGYVTWATYVFFQCVDACKRGVLSPASHALFEDEEFSISPF